jgi:hypothetical protein
VRGKRGGTAEGRRLALFESDSSSNSSGREKLRRQIPPRPVDNVGKNQREMREEGLGYL